MVHIDLHNDLYFHAFDCTVCALNHRLSFADLHGRFQSDHGSAPLGTTDESQSRGQPGICS